MNELKTVVLTRAAEAAWELRSGAEDNGGGIAHAARSPGNSLTSGFGRLRQGRTPSKTLDYDEVIYVLQGTLGVGCDGVDLSASAGDVLSISRGSTVTYFGTDAEFFFVATTI